jgi:hypothetical protein
MFFHRFDTINACHVLQLPDIITPALSVSMPTAISLSSGRIAKCHDMLLHSKSPHYAENFSTRKNYALVKWKNRF